MTEKDVEFSKRLRATFRMEAEEHILAITAGLLELEKTPDPVKYAEIIETTFREAHSLKGAARSVNLSDIESICQPLESAFAAMKRRELSLSPTLCDLFHQVVDHIARLASSINAERSPSEQSHTRKLLQQMLAVSQQTTAPQEKPVPPDSISGTMPVSDGPYMTGENGPLSAETVRIPTAQLGPLLLQAEEMTLNKMAAARRTAALREIDQALLLWKSESAKWKDRPDTEPAQQWNKWAEWNDERLSGIQSRVAAITRAVEHDQHFHGRIVDEHLEAMKRALMLPAASIVSAFPKFARDLLRGQGKEADLRIEGPELEVDKRVLEELKDPLIHLVRNCIDHGIEKPQERAAAGKQARGTIAIAFRSKDSRQAEILVSDDGAGIDLDRIRSAAVKAGTVTPERADKLNAQEVLSFIFQSGISTSPIITNISGHGLGLAIVREKVEKLGGSVSVDTQTRVGTTFRILLPLTLTTFRGVLVRVDDYLFILPTTNVERVVRVRKAEIRIAENRETIHLPGQILSMVRLADVLALPIHYNKSQSGKDDDEASTDYIPVAIVVSGDKRIAFQVDEVLDEQQVLVKGLGKQLRRVRNIAGATVLVESGKVVPVLHIPDLMKSAISLASTSRTGADNANVQERVLKILVAEDSITARTLLKNILETAGYQVVTAMDGVDAFTQLRSGEFDLLVSDVDMPRMSGFELTARVRKDKKLGELPVVLVTALESREDRERGIDVGANAYIVKSSFDQSNLLEVIKRLI
jgi:two-component system chemotaxis sensor kinase CheA